MLGSPASQEIDPSADVPQHVKVAIVIGRKTVRKYGFIYNHQMHAVNERRFLLKVAELKRKLDSTSRKLLSSDDALKSTQKEVTALQLAVKEQCMSNDDSVVCLKEADEAVAKVSPCHMRFFL